MQTRVLYLKMYLRIKENVAQKRRENSTAAPLLAPRGLDGGEVSAQARRGCRSCLAVAGSVAPRGRLFPVRWRAARGEKTAGKA